MSRKKTNRVIAIVLLIAFAAWLVFTILPGGGKSKRPGKPSARPVTVEPRFMKEGELAFVHPETKDTIQQIDIELAERPDEIQYGMMYRKSMDEQTGMLFIMPQERPQSFYMKNTYVSLDIIYINSRGEVVSIQKNARPLDETSLPSEGPAAFVLEVKGGYTDKYGIGKGTKIVWERS